MQNHIIPAAPFSSISTAALVSLAAGLDAYLSGGFKADSADYAELIDASVLAAIQAELDHFDAREALDEIAFELQRRHPKTIGASLAAWHAWNHRSITWAAALLDGADAADLETATTPA